MVEPGLHPTVTRVLTQAAQKLYGTAKRRREQRVLREQTRTLVPARVARGWVAELDEAEAHRLDDYLNSPEFEEIVLQYLLGDAAHLARWEELRTNIRHEIWLGLRNIGLRSELLTTATDVVFDSLVAAELHQNRQLERHLRDSATIATGARITAAAAANSRFLCEVGELAGIHEFAGQLRSQVVAIHGSMRLPHLGVSRSVPYDQLYVDPVLRPEQEGMTAPDPATLALPGRRSVILGDPGAGKSTMAAKLAHDVAAGLVPGAEGRVPFLLVLREFAGSFREGGHGLAHYLEQVCRAPYNLDPPPKAVEYLLRNGRAVVLLDGLDELVETELRRKFVQLVDGFVNRFPLVPMLVTARRIGYSDAPLDRETFTVGVVAELTEEQVGQYTRRWFALDAATAEADRERMAAAFLRESTNIADLRANPLLLALLCAMYSSEHYIPANLAQIYERCAVMLFDRWDVMRGIAEAPQFQGRLRAAVQHLAWRLFNAEESGKALPRHRIVRVLAEHLVAKRFDEDDAVAAAEQFVEFCTGRAWILSDVGATETEPRYGFTHRTFMEYFAAEHLVRTHPSAHRLWEVLRPRILAGEWEVVALVALQLLDRNVDGGIDDLLRLVLTETPSDDHDRAALHQFAARALGHVHPRHDVIRDVTAAALHDTLSVDIADRYRYHVSIDTFKVMHVWDEALHTLMYGCSPGNLPIVRRTVAAILDHQADLGSETAYFTILNLSRHIVGSDDRAVQVWTETGNNLCERHAAGLADWRARTPWDHVLSGVAPEQVVSRYGAWPLYVSDMFLTGSVPTIISRLSSTDLVQVDTDRLCAALLATPQPWINDAKWWTELSHLGGTLWSEALYTDGIRLTAQPMAVALLFLPYLESWVRGRITLHLPEDAWVLQQLATARRKCEADSGLLRMLNGPDFTEDVRDFLISWVRHEFDVVVPP